MTEPLRNHGDHGGATAVCAVQAPQWHRASGVITNNATINISTFTLMIIFQLKRYRCMKSLHTRTCKDVIHTIFFVFCNTYAMQLHTIARINN